MRMLEIDVRADVEHDAGCRVQDILNLGLYHEFELTEILSNSELLVSLRSVTFCENK